MSTPEQPQTEALESMPTPEEQEAFVSVLEELKNTAHRFKDTYESLDHFLTQKDLEGYNQRLTEMAQLLVALPARIAQPLEKMDRARRDRISHDTSFFAEQAQHALEKGGFAILTLLTHRGSTTEDKNDLEELIAGLEDL